MKSKTDISLKPGGRKSRWNVSPPQNVQISPFFLDKPNPWISLLVHRALFLISARSIHHWYTHMRNAIKRFIVFFSPSFRILGFGCLGLGVLGFGLLGLALVATGWWHTCACLGECKITIWGSFWDVFVVAKLRTRFGSEWEGVVGESEDVGGKFRCDEEVELIFIGACVIWWDEIRKDESFVVSHGLLMLLQEQRESLGFH